MNHIKHENLFNLTRLLMVRLLIIKNKSIYIFIVCHDIVSFTLLTHKCLMLNEECKSIKSGYFLVIILFFKNRRI